MTHGCPKPETDLYGLISRAAPDHAALVTPQGPSLTYRTLKREVERVADALVCIGMEKGARVAIVLPNGPEAVIAFLAASIAGVAAPLNPAYRLEEFRFYLEDTGAQALILPPGGMEAARRAAMPGTALLEIRSGHDGAMLLSADPAGSRRRSAASPAAAETALVLHTSGTTGRPKRVPLSHANLAASAQNIANTYALTEDDTSLCVMPLFHVHGLVGSVLSALASGGTVVVPRGGFNALSFWQTARGHGTTWYSAVPSVHQMLLARARGEARPAGAKKLRFIRSCSSALAPATMEALERAYGVPVIEAYGMTEAAHQMASNPLPPGDRKPGSVGTGTGIDIAIMNPDGTILAAGEQGEVVIRGRSVIAGYEGNPEANRESFTDGWFRTGDQGRLDGEAYLTLVGRIKELINRGGEKISPLEVDQVLELHPAVAEAATFAVPHRVYGEEVAAVIALCAETGEAEILAFCRERLADFKCPKKIYIVEKIPRGETGKIQRRKLAEILEP